MQRGAPGWHVQRSSAAASGAGTIKSGFWLILGWFAAHLVLALLMQKSEMLSTAHALLTVAVALVVMLRGAAPIWIACFGAYITGAEVLWRMNHANVFWEYGKYATSFIFLLYLLRSRRVRPPLLAGLYFCLLLPATMMTLTMFDWSRARQMVSSDLTGPFSLAVCVWFFTSLRLGRGDHVRITLALLGPVVGVASIAAFSTLAAGGIDFREHSNTITSGGFGPNQVSAMLGLGAICAFLAAMEKVLSRWSGWLLIVVMVLLLAQSALTFSRTGLYLTIATAAVAGFYLLRGRGTRWRLVLMTGAVTVVAALVIFPALDSFTQGALSRRFANTDLTGRDSIMQEDINLWRNHLLLGVGTGQGVLYRPSGVGAHTEFTRLLAEHGLLGLCAGILLFVMAFHHLWRARPGFEKAWVGSAVCWTLLFMIVSATRLVAPGFMFGFSTARLQAARRRRISPRQFHPAGAPAPVAVSPPLTQSNPAL